MSKKIKKLLSGLLVLSMIASSGVAAFAVEPDTSSDAAAATEVEDEDFKPYNDVDEPTEAPAAAEDENETAAPDATPKATEAATPTPEPTPEPTSEPTPEPSKYETDSYYKKALTLCQSLGIITGYEDGSVKPESTVTRAEMAAIILRMTNTESTSAYRNIFDDVTGSHWAASTIQTAADANVVNGMGDGTFNPDGDVLYEQALKMVVCGMNYKDEAEAKGGYPEGYLATASVNLRLLDGVNAVRSEAIVRGEIIKIIYNALLGPYHKITAYDTMGAPVYDLDDDTTLAKAKFDVYEEKGLLTGTHNVSITSSKPPKGQITIDDQSYLCDIEDIDSYVASEVTYYYVDDKKADPKVVAVTVNTAKTTEVTIDASDIKKIVDLESSGGTLDTESGKKYKLDSPYVIYNGDFINAATYAVAAANDTSARFHDINYSGEDTGNIRTYTDFITPDSGTVKLVDNDGDSKYDIMFIDEYECLVVNSATAKRIVGKIDNQSVGIDVDVDENANLEITVIKDGSEAKTKNLKKNDVVALTRNLAQDVLKFEVIEDKIVGKISAFTSATDSDFATAIINGTEYEVDRNAVSDCASGLEVTASLDKANRIGYVDSETVKAASEKYAWVMTNPYQSESGTDYYVKLFTEDGTAQTLKFAEKVNYWGPKDNDSTSSVSGTYIAADLKNSANYNTVSGLGTAQIRLVKFGTNSKGEVSKFYVANAIDSGLKKGSSNTSDEYDKKALVVSNANLRSVVARGSLVAGKNFSNDMTIFKVPNREADMNSISTYSVQRSASASAYVNKEDGVSKDFIVGEFSDSNQAYPTLLIEFVGSADAAKLVSDYGTASNNPCFMVDRIAKGVDDDENDVFTIYGYANGGSVRYTTKNNSILAVLGKMVKPTEASAIFSTKELYNATVMWDGINGVSKSNTNGTAYEGATSLTDIIAPGDVIGVSGGGEVLILMVDASVIAKAVVNGEDITSLSYSESASSTRDQLVFGAVSASDINDEAIMTVYKDTVSFDAGRSMDTAMIDASGKVDFNSSDVSTISDVEDFDENELTGDFAFVRYANKGSLQEVFLFRFGE